MGCWMHFRSLFYTFKMQSLNKVVFEDFFTPLTSGLLLSGFLRGDRSAVHSCPGCVLPSFRGVGCIQHTDVNASTWMVERQHPWKQQFLNLLEGKKKKEKKTPQKLANFCPALSGLRVTSVVLILPYSTHLWILDHISTVVNNQRKHNLPYNQLFCCHLFSVSLLVAQMVKKSAWSAGDAGLIPASGRSPAEGNGNPLQYSCLENSMDRL